MIIINLPKSVGESKNITSNMNSVYNKNWFKKNLM